MRRTALVIALMLVSIPAFAINRSRVRAGDRVGVLRSFPGERDPIERALVRELRARGIDAFDAEVTYDDLVRGDAASAAWYVEVSFAGHESPAGIGLGGRAIWVWLPLPLLTRNSAVDEMARDAAARIAQESC